MKESGTKIEKRKLDVLRASEEDTTKTNSNGVDQASSSGNGLIHQSTSFHDEYELDTSDEEDLRNTIGNVPLKWYDEYDHVGYDLMGKKITKPADAKRDDELDKFLNKMDDPDYWRTVTDRQTGAKIVLTDEDIEIIKRLTRGKYASDNVEEYETAPVFTQDEMKMPLSGRPEHKRSFVPSQWERMQVGKYVHAIKMGWIRPRIKKAEEKTDSQPKFYDLWGQDSEQDLLRKHMHHLPAPKLPLPDHYESYNPPPEYLFDEEERAKWESAEKEERKLSFLPKKYSALRLVPAFDGFIQERFDRCLDLYMCPRQRKLRVQLEDERALLPPMPRPRDLQPFPTTLAITFKGHKSLVTSISVHISGQWLLSSSNDKTVKCWEVSTGRCLNTWTFESKCVFCSWLPISNMLLFSVAFDNKVVIINPKVGDKVLSSSTDIKLVEFKNQQQALISEDNKKKTSKDEDEDDELNEENSTSANKNTPPCEWKFYSEKENDFKAGFRVQILLHKNVKNVAWHPKGDYFVSVLDDKNSNSAVIMHQLSKTKSVRPFAKMNGNVQQVLFHPVKPILFVATQRFVKVYDLVKQILVKKLLTNVKWVSSMDIHPGGDNLIVGSYDNRISWFDLDLSNKPYKTLKNHQKPIRNVAFHKKYPLFASASDDGTAIVCHGMVYDDLMQNALIVPLKILRGHEIVKSIGLTCCKFHPTQPWLFTCGADKTIRLYSN